MEVKARSVVVSLVVICPVEFRYELSALRRRWGMLEGGNSSAVLRGGNGADDETTDVC
jgi:hypothetical protein